MKPEYILKGIKTPKEITFEKEEQNKFYGRFIAVPFERGFATTIGNSLRRTLLSVIPGYAITAVKIENVFHEFTSIPGIKEDVINIILNLKNVVLKLQNDLEQKEISIIKKGPLELKAADLEVEPDIKVFNPSTHIATLNKEAKLEMRLLIEEGRGYVPSEEIKERLKTKEIGFIPIDANFSPIIKSNFKVENYRLGERYDYEKLILEVWTNGTIKPEDAIAQAAKILKEHFTIFINFPEVQLVEEKEVEPLSKEEIKVTQILNTLLSELELPGRAIEALIKSNIKTVNDIISKKKSELLEIENFGEKSYDEINTRLFKQWGLKLGMSEEEIKNWKENEIAKLKA